MSKQDIDFSVDPGLLNKEYNLFMKFFSSSNSSIVYKGYIDTILDYGVRVVSKETCAVGHVISFKILKDEIALLDGTGKVESIEVTEQKDLKYVICSFSQFSEKDKKILMEKAQMNQNEISDYMDDLN